MQPLRDRIFVQPDPERDDVAAFGIAIPARKGIHTSNEQLGLKGTVAAIGPDVDPEQLKIGDRVLFGEFQYQEYHHEGVRYFVMQDKDICGVIEPADPQIQAILGGNVWSPV